LNFIKFTGAFQNLKENVILLVDQNFYFKISTKVNLFELYLFSGVWYECVLSLNNTSKHHFNVNNRDNKKKCTMHMSVIKSTTNIK